MEKTSTRKLLINISSIISIIYSIMIIAGGIILLFCANIVTYDFIVEILTQDGSISQYTNNELNMIVSITKNFFIFSGLYCILIGIAQMVIAIILNCKNSSLASNKGLIISLLILSIFTANFTSVGLLIATLCLKIDKNINDVFIELDKNDNSNSSFNMEGKEN